MSSLVNLFDKFGVYFFLGLLVLWVLVALWVFILQRSIKKIFKGETMDLERVLLDLRNRQDISDKILAELKSRAASLEEALPKDIRRVGLVRYNPFSDAGGDQSFVLALLNDHRDGVVITSLYGREINRFYAKPIQKGQSTYQLTLEERQAIDNAQ